ncbi:MAG: NADP-dependent malic enzyme [Firmicutes bacterium]|nr:NADP-dependent malic enzyme [Bacillota bacterium]
MDIKKQAVELHASLRGKISVKPTVSVRDKNDLSLVYTPGVAEVCMEIAKDSKKSYDYTRRWNTVAVITDGTAVLGLGDIGPEASMPVMEGKCLLFSEFAGIDAFPICVDTKDTDEIVDTIRNISKSFGGINLEDISAPRCFEIEKRLKELCDIPVFHDDQHGTAVVVTAALINALKVAGKSKEDIKLVINGAGSAGCAIGKLLARFGVKNIIYVDRLGAICEGGEMLNSEHERLSHVSNPNHEKGSLADVVKGADVFIGVSRPGLLTSEMIASMNDKAIVFAMANPVPEIMPDAALAAGAFIVGTGRSDFSNQINNLLAFPGIFRGALDARASDITEEMKVAAATAIASVVSEDELSPEYIIPSPFNKAVVEKVASAVASAWNNRK